MRFALCLLLLFPMTAWADLQVNAGRTADDHGPMAVEWPNQKVATSDRLGRVQVWDLARRRRLARLDTKDWRLQSLQFVGGGRMLLIRTPSEVRLWNLETQEVSVVSPRAPATDANHKLVPTPKDAVVDVAVSDDLSTVATSWSNGVLTGVTARRGDKERVVYLQPDHLALSRTGRLLAGIGYGGLSVAELHADGKVTDLIERMEVKAIVVRDGPRFDHQEKRLVFSTYSTTSGAQRSERIVWVELESREQKVIDGAGSPAFLSDGRLTYLDGEGCLHVRAWPDDDRALAVPCQRNSVTARHAIVSSDVIFLAGGLFDSSDGTRLGALRSRALVQDVLRVDELNGRLDVQPRAELYEGLREPFRWDLRRGVREPLPWSSVERPAPGDCRAETSASSDEVHEGKPRLVIDGEDGKRYRIDLIGLSVCEPKSGRWRALFARPAGLDDGPNGVPLFLRVLTLGKERVALILDHRGTMELWDLARRKRTHTRTFPVTTAHGGWTRAQPNLSPLLEACGLGKELVVVTREGAASTRPLYEGSVDTATCDEARGQVLFAGQRGLGFADLKGVHFIESAELRSEAVTGLRRGAGHTLYATTDEGGLWLVDLRRREVIAALYAFGSDGSAIITRDGEYFANRTGVRELAFREGLRLIPSEELDMARNRPERVLPKLGYAKPEDLASLERLVRLREKRTGESPSPAPFQIGWRTRPPLVTRTPGLTLELASDKQMSGRLHVTVNDVLISGEGAQVEGTELRFPMELADGENVVRAWVTTTSESGTQRTNSLEAHVVARLQLQREPLTWFVGIGVSDYQSNAHDLQFAAKDVGDVARTLEGMLGDRLRTHVLTDAMATRDAIAKVEELLAQSSVNDRVILYFAGHGLLGQDQRYYFAPHDMDFGKPEERGLAYSEIDRLLRLAKARRRLVFIDSCHSGDAAGVQGSPAEDTSGARGTTFGVTQAAEGQVVARAARRVKEIPAAARVIDQPLVEDLFLDLREGSGADVIAAAGAVEFALESAQWNNGVFTFSLLEALATKRADEGRDGEIDANELRRHISKRVSDLTRGRQVPTSRAENRHAPFPVLTARRPDRTASFARDAKAAKVEDGVVHLGHSGDGARLITWSGAGLQRWDAKTLQLQDSLTAPAEALEFIDAAAIDHAGNTLAWIAGEDDTLWVARFGSREVVSLAKRNEDASVHAFSTPLALNSDGSKLAAWASRCRGIAVWKLRPTEAAAPPTLHALPGCESPDAIAFQDERLVAATASGSIHWIGLGQGMEGATEQWLLPHPSGPDAPFTDLPVHVHGALGARGRYYARPLNDAGPAAEEGRVAVWDLQERKPLGIIRSPAMHVRMAATSPRLAVVRSDVRLFDLPSLQERDWLGDSGPLGLGHGALSPDGRSLVTGGYWGRALHWTLPPVR